jgi:acyl-CoA synthetase (AMP-forming)/AMP-acid ligase II
MLLVLPFYHIYGLGVMTMALQRGATGVVMSKFDPTIFLSSIEHFKVS